MAGDRTTSPGGERFEYLMYLRLRGMSAQDVEFDLTRLNMEFGWRCVAFVPSATSPDGSINGYFLLERPVHADESSAG